MVQAYLHRAQGCEQVRIVLWARGEPTARVKATSDKSQHVISLHHVWDLKAE